MTFKDDVLSDLDVFFDEDEFADVVVWTPKGGVAQPSFNAIVDETILHGDDEQNLDVVPENIVVQAKTSDVSLVKLGDNFFITFSLIGVSTNYEVINNPYPDDEKSGVSIIDVRLPRRNKTKI
jgi:hypothetical protein